MARPRKPRPYRTRSVRYTLDGRRCTRDTPGAVRSVEESRTYYADLYPHGFRERFSLDTDDVGQAWIELRKLQARHAAERAGIADPYTGHAGTPIAEHVAAWVQALRDEGRTGAEQVALLEAHVRLLVELAGWRSLVDVTSTSARAALGRLATTPGRGSAKVGRGPRTRNHYATHLKQFIGWCHADRRIRENPLLDLGRVSVETGLRHARRSPTDAEVALLLAYLEGPDAAVRAGLSGPGRALAYLVAMATGFRAGELQQLERVNFELDAGAITAPAAYSKHRRIDRQHVPQWLVDRLRRWFDGGGGTFNSWPHGRPGRALESDLWAAGVERVTIGPDGVRRFLDFHSLRKYYVSAVASQPDIDPKTLMTMARHSTPTLSLQVYAETRQELQRAAADRIKEPGRPAETRPG